MSNHQQEQYPIENETTDVGKDTFFADTSAVAEQSAPKQGMSKNLKGLLIAIAVLVILGGALTAVLLLNQQQDNSEPIDTDSLANQLLDDEDTAIMLNPEVADDVTEIEISNTDNFKVSLQSQATEDTKASYTIQGFEDIALDTGLISTLVNNASQLSANALVEENASDLDKYGLNSPLANVVMHYANGTDFAFSVGSAFPMDDSQTYCEVNGSVYLVKSSLMANYQKNSSAFISNVILEEPDEANYPIVESVRIERQDLDYDIYMEYDYDTVADTSVGGTLATHKMLEPVTVYLNVEKSADITNGMFGLTAVEIAKIHPSDTDLAAAGINDPFCTVTMKCDDGKDYILHFGKQYTTENGTDAYYAYLEGTNILYGVAETRAVWTTVLPGDIHSANIFGTNVWDIATLDITSNEQELHFNGKGEDADSYIVTKNGETCDTERFRLLYRFLLNIYGDELFFETELPAGTPDVEIHLTSQDGNENYTVSFYQLTDMNAIIAVNGIPTYKVRSSCIDTIRHNLEIFDNPEEEFSLTWQ